MDQSLILTSGLGIRSDVWRGIKAALPLVVGFIPFGLVLGARATERGFSVIEVPLLTGLNFGGGSEFAALQLWTSPPHVLLIVAVAFLVNSRHLLMGAALAPMLQHLPKRKALPALFLMCDESWVLGLAEARQSSRGFSLAYYLGAAVPLYLIWVVSTAAGALLGPVLGDVSRYGFDMAFPAVFFVMLAGMWKSAREARPWLVSLITACATYLLLPGAWYVPAGVAAGVLASYLWAPTK